MSDRSKKILEMCSENIIDKERKRAITVWLENCKRYKTNRSDDDKENLEIENSEASLIEDQKLKQIDNALNSNMPMMNVCENNVSENQPSSSTIIDPTESDNDEYMLFDSDHSEYLPSGSSFNSTESKSESAIIEKTETVSIICPSEGDDNEIQALFSSNHSEHPPSSSTSSNYMGSIRNDDQSSHIPIVPNIEPTICNGYNSIVAVSRRRARIWDRKDLCPFCFIECTHFARHIERKHKDEPRVKKILTLKKGSHERRNLWNCLKKEGNFYLFRENKKVIPVRRPAENETKNAKDFGDFAVCESCFGIYKKRTLYRHVKSCPGRINKEQKNGRLYALTQSQTFLAAARCHNEFLEKSRLKSEVFSIMRPDNISEIAKTDLLICLFGETHLKKHKREQIVTVTSNKMRELARLLMALKDITPINQLIEVMKPEYFDELIAATKVIAGFDLKSKSFKASSLALHMGTSLKQLCGIVLRTIIKKSPLFSFDNPKKELKNLKNLQKLITEHWANEVASLALKDLTEKHWEKPQIIPVTSDIIQFNTYVRNEVERASTNLEQMISEKGAEDYIADEPNLIPNYKQLAKGIMALLLVLNRKRIGEIQHLKISTYVKDFKDKYNQEELINSLSISERLLCKSFKRVVVGGKRNRPVPILISPYIQQKINVLLAIRKKIQQIAITNDYMFANPDSTKGWFHGVSVIRKFASLCGAKDPASLSSTKFRKQTATILQVMNINENDMEQLATFMGHTKKTHEEWYRLPQDVYQTAKIAKLLMIIDKGEANQYKGKGLEHITLSETDLLDLEHPMNSKSTKQINEEIKSNFDEEGIPEGVERDSIQIEPLQTKAIRSRQRWGDKEKEIMLKYFEKFIENKKVPKKKEVEEFKSRQKILFKQVSWVRIKTFVYNQYRISN